MNTQTQIASFIKPALHGGLLKECVQIRSEAKLVEIIQNSKFKIQNYIVDIDLDFFVHETNVSNKMNLLRQLISSAPVVTIATSPYFLDQHRAIELIHLLLDGLETDN